MKKVDTFLSAISEHVYQTSHTINWKNPSIFVHNSFLQQRAILESRHTNDKRPSINHEMGFHPGTQLTLPSICTYCGPPIQYVLRCKYQGSACATPTQLAHKCKIVKFCTKAYSINRGHAFIFSFIKPFTKIVVLTIETFGIHNLFAW